MSSDEAQLLAAIAAAPDDDRPRLVYADWLTERGDPRGELIVLACELARLGQRPGDGARRCDIAWRHDALLWEHPEWTRDSTGLLQSESARDRWQLERGLPQIVCTEMHTFLGCASSLRGAAPLWSGVDLWMEHNHDDQGVLQLATCPELAGLRAFRLRGSNLVGEGARALAASPHLTGLREVSLGQLAAALYAQRLARSGDGAALRVLRLQIDPRAGKEVFKSLAASRSLGALEVLDLRSSWLDNTAMQQLVRVQLPRLHTLHVGSSHAVPEAMPLLAECPWLSQLRTLDLEGCGGGLRELLAAPRLGPLDVLALGACLIDRELAKRLAAWEGLASVVELDVGRNNIGNAGVRALVTSPHAASLRRLGLMHAGVGEVAARALLDSPHLGRLRVLDLRNNRDLPVELRAPLVERFGQVLL